MKRLLFISLILCTFNNNVNGQGRPVDDYSGLTFGAEWSYVGTVHGNMRYNYFNPEGYRVNRRELMNGYWSNAEALLHVGYNFNKHWNLSFYAGVTGIADLHNAVPISLRATYLFGKDALSDRWLAFADIGTGVSIKSEPQEIWTGKLGGGYRLSLSRDTKLDLIAAIRLTCTRPQIIDGNDIITLEWTNRNTAWVESFSLGMSLTF